MLAENLYDLRRTLGESNTIFAYSGYVTEDIRLAVGETLKRQLILDAADTTTLRSVFAVFVEQMQNVIRYSVEESTSTDDVDALRFGILTVGRAPEGYVIMSGNLIDSNDIDRVSGHVEQLRGMEKPELKVMYKEKLREGPDEHSKGAGIGLIEIARRATYPLEFDVHRYDDNRSFFALKAVI